MTARRKKNLAILGSTGSIGENALNVVRHLPGELSIVALAAGRNYRRLAEQALEFGVKKLALRDDSAFSDLKKSLPDSISCHSGIEGICEIACAPEVDIVLCSIVGIEGVFPVLSAIRSGKDIALASKEVLVLAGEIVMSEAAKHGVRILPVDSEHSAIFQCLEGRRNSEISTIVLTASGGPFKDLGAEELARVNFADATMHPVWNMGDKVTVDSATMMNKALEIIEARWLFNMPPEKIDVLVHPQSIVHSMVEFIDGSVIAQMGVPDMRNPIQAALTYPERRRGSGGILDLAAIGSLHFERPDLERFPSIAFAYLALAAGGTMPAVMNAANEVAFERFRAGKTSFPGIWKTIEKTMNSHTALDHPSLDAILSADSWARDCARSLQY